MVFIAFISQLKSQMMGYNYGLKKNLKLLKESYLG